jgi:hypothetical protein
MAYQTIHVPPQHVDELRAALLDAHARCVEQLTRELARYRAGQDQLDALEGALVEIRDLHDAIDQIGWARGAQRGGPVEVTLHPEVLDEAIGAMVGGWAAPPRLTDR